RTTPQGERIAARRPKRSEASTADMRSIERPSLRGRGPSGPARSAKSGQRLRASALRRGGRSEARPPPPTCARSRGRACEAEARAARREAPRADNASGRAHCGEEAEAKRGLHRRHALDREAEPARPRPERPGAKRQERTTPQGERIAARRPKRSEASTADMRSIERPSLRGRGP